MYCLTCIAMCPRHHKVGSLGLGGREGWSGGRVSSLGYSLLWRKGTAKKIEEKKKKKKRRRRGSWSKKPHIGESDLKWSRLGSMFIGLL